MLDDDRYAELLDTRARHPEAIAEAAATRPRRLPLVGERGNLLLLAADHTARGILGVGDRPMAMADRRDLLGRLLTGLSHPGVDGVVATADVLEDLLLLGALDHRVAIGSMNRGGLVGAVYELDDRLTGWTVAGIRDAGLDGGKLLLRVAEDDPGSLATMTMCAEAVSGLARSGLMAVVEPFAARPLPGGGAENDLDPDAMTRAVTVASGLGTTSARTWLKLPVTDEMERVVAATTLPVLLLGGDPGPDPARTLAAWERALALPQVRGLVVGRSLLYPVDGDVAGAVDAAARLLPGPVEVLP
jgi:hypothetical protein